MLIAFYFFVMAVLGYVAGRCAYSRGYKAGYSNGYNNAVNWPRLIEAHILAHKKMIDKS